MKMLMNNNSFDNNVIVLNQNKISDKSIEILAPYLDGNITFKRLDWSGDRRITDKSIPFLVKMIESSHIEDMDVDNTSITQENSIDVWISLACNTFKYGSTKLDLSYK